MKYFFRLHKNFIVYHFYNQINQKKKIILASGMEIKIILKIKEKILENLKDPLPYDSIIHDNIL